MARALQRRLLQLPLEVGAALSNDDAHYLAKRSRSRWWSGGATGLRVPGASLGEVHRHPPPLSVWQKVAPLGLIFFAASFNLTILANLKDAIMVTTAGAETLPFLASLVVLPASLGFFMLYGRMVERLPSQAVFYAAGEGGGGAGAGAGGGVGQLGGRQLSSRAERGVSSVQQRGAGAAVGRPLPCAVPR